MIGEGMEVCRRDAEMVSIIKLSRTRVIPESRETFIFLISDVKICLPVNETGNLVFLMIL